MCLSKETDRSLSDETIKSAGPTQGALLSQRPGVEIVADELGDRGVTDLTPQLTKIKRGGEVVIGEIYGSSAPLLYNQWAELRVPALIAHMVP
jgi:hypothetical protein